MFRMIMIVMMKMPRPILLRLKSVMESIMIAMERSMKAILVFGMQILMAMVLVIWKQKQRVVSQIVLGLKMVWIAMT